MGDSATIINPNTGENLKTYVFVGVVTYSQYAYVEIIITTPTSHKSVIRY